MTTAQTLGARRPDSEPIARSRRRHLALSVAYDSALSPERTA